MQKYWHLVKLSFINRLDYRQELVMSLFIGIIVFTGQAIFWHAAFEGKEVVNGFTLYQILLYYLFARMVSEVIDSRVGFRVCEHIIEGHVTNFLLKPVGVQMWLFSQEIGRVLIDLLIKVGVYFFLFAWMFGMFTVPYANLPLFFISAIFSLLISFSIFLMVGCVAFWVDTPVGLVHALRRTILFLSGGLVPLAFFPETFRQILHWSPFAYLFDLPIKILTDKIEWVALWQGLGIQLVWVIALWWIAGRLLGFAIKNNESVGI